MQQNLDQFASAAESTFPKRVFCDVHDTLENPAGERGPAWNEPLLRLLTAMRDVGYEIILFSGSPKRTACVQEMCSAVFGKADIFGLVRDKRDCAGERAEYVFDNDHDSHDIEARFKLGPLDEAIFSLYRQITGASVYQVGLTP